MVHRLLSKTIISSNSSCILIKITQAKKQQGRRKKKETKLLKEWKLAETNFYYIDKLSMKGYCFNYYVKQNKTGISSADMSE